MMEGFTRTEIKTSGTPSASNEVALPTRRVACSS